MPKASWPSATVMTHYKKKAAPHTVCNHRSYKPTRCFDDKTKARLQKSSRKKKVEAVVTGEQKVPSKHKQELTAVSLLFSTSLGEQFLLHEACTLTTAETDPQDGNRLKKVSAYSGVDSSKCCILVEFGSDGEKICGSLLEARRLN